MKNNKFLQIFAGCFIFTFLTGFGMPFFEGMFIPLFVVGLCFSVATFWMFLVDVWKR